MSLILRQSLWYKSAACPYRVSNNFQDDYVFLVGKLSPYFILDIYKKQKKLMPSVLMLGIIMLSVMALPRSSDRLNFGSKMGNLCQLILTNKFLNQLRQSL